MRRWLSSGSLRILLAWIVVLSGWETAFRLIQWPAWKFPSPTHIVDSTFELAGVRTGFSQPLNNHWPRAAEGDTRRLAGAAEEGDSAAVRFWKIPLGQGLVVTGIRLLAGFLLAILLGVTLGLAMWRFGFVDGFFGPLCLGLQTLPSVCWVPLSIIIFGLREEGVLFVLIMGSCFAIAISLRDGLRTIPPVYQKAGRMLGASGWKLYRYVLLPASLPAMASSLRQGFSFAWRSLMGAELVFTSVSNHGLGFLLDNSRNAQDVAQVLAIMILMVALAMLVDRLFFARMERQIHARFGLVAQL